MVSEELAQGAERSVILRTDARALQGVGPFNRIHEVIIRLRVSCARRRG